MIQVDKLTKVYGDFTAIRNVSFQVEKGEILGFLGPNGAGKTTTMRILTCYTPATSGKANVAGYDVFKQSLEVRRRIGYMPESIPLYPEMVVRSYLRFMAEAKGIRGAKARAAVDQAMEECGLGDVRDRLIGHISRGYRQRVGLAQAVLGDPVALILDEPTIGLDPRQIVEIRELIRGMAGKRTVILSTHILPEVSMTCQRVLIINRGSIVASGTPEEMVSEADKTSSLEVVVKGDPEQARMAISSAPGVLKVEVNRGTQGDNLFFVQYDSTKDPRARIAQALSQDDLGLLELRRRGLTLEDVFIRVVSGEQEGAAEHAA